MEIAITRTVSLELTEQEAIHLYNLLEVSKSEVSFSDAGELKPFLDQLLVHLQNAMQITDGKD